MDSTTVSIIAKAATDLGMTGAQAFGWYLAAKLAGNIIVAGVILTVATLAYRLANRNLIGNRLFDACGIDDGWFRTHRIGDAERIVREALEAKRGAK